MELPANIREDLVDFLEIKEDEAGHIVFLRWNESDGNIEASYVPFDIDDHLADGDIIFRVDKRGTGPLVSIPWEAVAISSLLDLLDYLHGHYPKAVQKFVMPYGWSGREAGLVTHDIGE